MIEQFFEFSMRHPLLVGLLVALLLIWLLYEVRRSNTNAVDASRATALVNREEGVIIDIRDAAAFKEGHIAGAINVPNGVLANRMNELEQYRARPIVLVCKMGQTATAAATVLEKAGFERVTRLKGGMAQWQADGLPTTRK